jgi:epoxyqueuosine reductase
VDWLDREGKELRAAYERLYVPRNDPRYLKRNALVALGNTGAREHRAAVEAFVDDPDPLLREHAAWALARIDERNP